MKPITRVWYTKPPINNKYYGTNYDWNQGIIILIDDFVKEARERNHYGINLLEYVAEEEINQNFKKVIKCHPKLKNNFNLDVWIYTAIILYWNMSPIEIEYNSEYHPNILKYVDGLYENEIILIDEPSKE